MSEIIHKGRWDGAIDALCGARFLGEWAARIPAPTRHRWMHVTCLACSVLKGKRKLREAKSDG